MLLFFRFLAFLSIPLLLLTGCQRSEKSLRVGIDPLPRVVTMENHYESLWAWKKASVRNRIAVHIDTHIDLNWMPEKDNRVIMRANNSSDFQAVSIRPGQFYEPGKRVLHVGNWLYPALGTGMVRELYWVVPDSSVHSARWLKALKTGMRLHFTNVNPQEIESFHIRDSTIVGHLFGIPVTILPLNRLPVFNEPVLLDIDLDYFQFDSALWLNRLPAPKQSVSEFVTVLKNKKITSDLVTVCYSVEQGYLDFKNRTLGDSLRGILTTGKNAYLILPGDSAMRQISVNDRKLFRADAHFYDRNYRKAADLYREFIRHRPARLMPYFNLAECELNLGQPGEALQRLNSIKTKASQFSQFCGKMGDAHFALFDFRQAVQDYRKALALDSENGRLWEKLGLTFERLNDFRQAKMAFQKGIRFWPYAPHIRMELYSLYKHLGLPDRARNCLVQILETDPADFNAWMELGRIYRAEQQPELAKKAFQRALQIRPLETTVLTALGEILIQDKDYASAESLFLRAIEIDPKNLDLKGNLGVLLLRTKKWPAAENIFRQILTGDPENALAWYNLALALSLQGKNNDAKKAIQKSIAFGGEKFRKLARNNPLFSKPAFR